MRETPGCCCWGGRLDPGSQLTLKGAVLGLLLSHPGGIPLRDLGRLFHQHHGRRLDLPRHGYRSLRHLLGDLKELVVLDEEGKEPWVRCRHSACDLLPEAKPPKRRSHHPGSTRRRHPNGSTQGLLKQLLGLGTPATTWLHPRTIRRPDLPPATKPAPGCPEVSR
ncbi:unnamed protein product [Eretmochelys imbricata]